MALACFGDTPVTAQSLKHSLNIKCFWVFYKVNKKDSTFSTCLNNFKCQACAPTLAFAECFGNWKIFTSSAKLQLLAT